MAILTPACVTSSDHRAPKLITTSEVSCSVAAKSVQGSEIDYCALGSGSETIFIMGGIHGNEPAGVVLAEQFKKHLLQNRYLLSGRKIVIVSCANPDGIAANTRSNSRGIDLNRNFPADNRQNTDRYGMEPLSEPESRVLYDLVTTYRPVRILTLHQPLDCVDFDGPGSLLAARFSALCGLPVRKLGAFPGSMGSWAGETLQIPVVTLEMPAEDSKLTGDQLWKKYGLAMIDFVRGS